MADRKKYWEENLWSDLQGKDPDQICRNTGVDFDQSGFYKVPSLGREIRVFPQEKRFESEDPELSDNPDFQLLIISYLLYGQNIELTEEWISEKDMNGGSLFFRGPHALPSAPLESRFGDDKELFTGTCRQLKGEPCDYGDAAMRFPVLPKIGLIIVLWLKDEEFPARVTFLMDRTTEAHLPLDVISAMVVSVTERLLSF